MNCFGDTQPTSMPFGSALAFVGTIHRAFQASADTNKWTIQRPGPFVSFGWPLGLTSKATVVSASSWCLSMENARPSVLLLQNVSVS